MKYKIIADSSCDLSKDYLKDTNIGFDIAPLTIHVGDKSFVDDENLNINEMLNAMHEYKAKCTSSCPNPYDYLSRMEDAENIFIVTISKKLSGSYNSAILAKEEMNNKNVLVIDSKATSGTMVRIIDELVNLINKGLSFEEISEQILRFRDNRILYFVLDIFDNLVHNGRVKKSVAFLANLLKIKLICHAEEGEIDVLQKVRTRKHVIDRLIQLLSKTKEDFSNEECVISHCEDEETASFIKKSLEKLCNFKKITILKMKGLCSFYALEKGVLVSI